MRTACRRPPWTISPWTARDSRPLSIPEDPGPAGGLGSFPVFDSALTTLSSPARREMEDNSSDFTRRDLFRRAGVVSLGAIAARGPYDLLDEVGGSPARASAAATVRRREEQYLVDSVEVILDNGVTCAIPPLHNDVITARLASGRTWTTSALKSAQTRVENALATVEKPYPSTAAGLTMVIGWGLAFFQTYLPQPLWSAKLPVDIALSNQTGATRYAVLDAIRFPSDPAGTILEDNHVMVKLRSDSSDILRSVEGALFDNPNSGAYIGDLFDLTSKRMGFLG